MHKEILFLKETNDHIAIWEGAKLNKKQAIETSGVQAVYWLDEFESVFEQLMSEVKTLYINNNNHYRQAVEMETREDRFIKTVKQIFQIIKLKTIFPSWKLFEVLKSQKKLL